MFFKSVAALLLRITVVIYNSQAVPEREMARAQAFAGRILQQSGVDVVWRQATPSDINLGPAEIPLHILSTHPARLGPRVGGYATMMPEGSYAGVSWPEVRRTAAELECDESSVLGAVMTHELGHVLLGSRDHSTYGVMVMRFGPRELLAARRGELLFLKMEGQRIREEVARRIRADAARRATILR